MAKISPAKIKRINELLAEGLDPLAIMERLGEAANTVYAVLHGTAEPKKRKSRAGKTDDAGLIFFDPFDDPVWCEKCRTHVQPPCHACRTRAAMAEGKR